MSVIIRYADPEFGDYFISAPSEYHAGGYWVSGRRDGERLAMRFADEAEARAFLVRRACDLKITFQPVED